jgi:metal-responsive CopG/Arc/MetJ family transcriptional regulator
MPRSQRQYAIISVSLPRDLIERANTVIPKAKRSRVIAGVLTTFLDSISRKKLEQEYTAYYAKRSVREAQAERDLLAEWELSDEEAWAILEKEEPRGRRTAR